MATNRGSWKKGQSGNLNGRPKGKVGIERLIGGIDPAELALSECEVRERFRILNELYGWFGIALSQEGFPDFVLENSNGETIRAEVETISHSFLAHGHPVEECDLIICWRHNWADCPLPVLTLSVEWVNYLQLRQVRPFVVGRSCPVPMKQTPKQLQLSLHNKQE